MTRPGNRGPEKIRTGLRFPRLLRGFGGVDVDVARTRVVDVLCQNRFQDPVEFLDRRVAEPVVGANRIEENQRLGIERSHVQIIREVLVDFRHRS